MNNEPVAWRRVIGNVTKHYEYNEVGVGEPLYDLQTVRQQQAEIEALEQSKDRLIKTLLDVRGQQPTAYINKYADGKENLDNGTDLTAEQSVPLFTYPTKELTLTDEEILISAQYNGIRASEILDEYVIAFARAILRKAGEK